MKVNRNGFSLTELIIAVVIIAILAIVGINIYKAMLMRAIATEGKTLMGLVARAEKTYWVEYGKFYGYTGIEAGSGESSGEGGEASDLPDEWKKEWSDVLGVDARTNTYFKTMEFINASATDLKVQSAIEAPYKDLTVVLTIDGMTAGHEVKHTIKLYDMAHDKENTIDEEL